MNDGVTFTPAGIAVVTALLVALAGTVAVVFKLLIQAKDTQIADMREQREGFKKGFERVVTAREYRADQLLIAQGIVPIPKIAPVVPEENSPITEKQQQAAELETLKARAAAAAIILDNPPVEPTPPKVEVAVISTEAAQVLAAEIAAHVKVKP